MSQESTLVIYSQECNPLDQTSKFSLYLLDSISIYPPMGLLKKFIVGIYMHYCLLYLIFEGYLFVI